MLSLDKKHKFLHGFAQRGRNQQSNRFHFLSNRCGRMSIFLSVQKLTGRPILSVSRLFVGCRIDLKASLSTEMLENTMFLQGFAPHNHENSIFFNDSAVPETCIWGNPAGQDWNSWVAGGSWTCQPTRRLFFCLHFAADVWTKNLSRSIEVLRIGLHFRSRLVWKLLHISFSRLPVTKLKLMAAETFWTKSGFAWIWKEIVRNQFDSRCQAKDILEPRKKSSHTI